jgi:predicted nucleic acid-binding Zn finger protein
MFEARLEEGVIFKKIVDAIKDLVKNVNLDSNGSGISLQVVVMRERKLVFHQGHGFFSCCSGCFGVERKGVPEVPLRSKPDNGSEHREPQQDPKVRGQR